MVDGEQTELNLISIDISENIACDGKCINMEARIIHDE